MTPAVAEEVAALRRIKEHWDIGPKHLDEPTGMFMASSCTEKSFEAYVGQIFYRSKEEVLREYSDVSRYYIYHLSAATIKDSNVLFKEGLIKYSCSPRPFYVLMTSNVRVTRLAVISNGTSSK